MTPYEYARADQGLTEIAGPRHEPEIVAAFAAVGHGWVKDDETAWCAAKMGQWILQAGYPVSTLPPLNRRLAAQSYKDVGVEVEGGLANAKPGDILVWRRGPEGSWQGHVGFFVREALAGRVAVLGANQSNMVRESLYPIDEENYKLIAVRRLPPLTPPMTAEQEEDRDDAMADLLDFIANLESGLDYNVIVWLVDRSRYPSRDLTAMTINEVLAWQDKIDPHQQSEAVGAYQILEDTLRHIFRRAGFTGEETFNEDTQDALAIELIKSRGLERYLRGDMTVERFCNNLAMEWASLPVVTDIIGHRGKPIKAGQSYYAGDSVGNRALANAARFKALVLALRESPQTGDWDFDDADDYDDTLNRSPKAGLVSVLVAAFLGAIGFLAGLPCQIPVLVELLNLTCGG